MKNLTIMSVVLTSFCAFSASDKKYEECKVLDYKTVSEFSYKTGKVLTVGITEKALNSGEKIIKKALVDSTESSSRFNERLEYKIKKLEMYADENCLRIDDRTASI